MSMTHGKIKNLLSLVSKASSLSCPYKLPK